MKKIKNFVNINYLWLLLGSYLVVVLVNLLRFSTEVLFLKLGAVGVTTTVIGLVVSYLILWFLLEYKKFLNIRQANIILSALILFMAILKSPTFFLSLGLVMISVALFLLFHLEKVRLAMIYPLGLLLSFPKLLIQASSDFKNDALGIHSFNIAESKFSMLIWPVLVSVFIAILIGLLINRLAVEKINAVWVKRLTLVALIGGLCYVLYLSAVILQSKGKFSIDIRHWNIFPDV